MFLAAGSEMITFLQRMGVRLVRCRGGRLLPESSRRQRGPRRRGRALRRGPRSATSERQAPAGHGKKNYGFVLATNELRSVQYFQPVGPRLHAVATRCSPIGLARARRREVLTNGASLIGQILCALMNSRRRVRRGR